MRAILLPVKEFRRSKERLAPHYTEDATHGAGSGSMRGHVPRRRAGEGDGPRLCRECGIPCAQPGAAAELAHRQRARAGLRKCVRRCRIAALQRAMALRRCSGFRSTCRSSHRAISKTLFYFLEPAPSVVIVPSHDGTGTNALLRSPPDLFPSHFGPESFALHLKEAETAWRESRDRPQRADRARYR